MEEKKDFVYPSIVFKVKGNYYAINSKNVATIMKMPECEILPDSPDNVIGIFKFREKVVPLVDVRLLFGMATIEQESKDFQTMLDTRKQDHVNWVKELNRSVKAGERFTLATDPHKCAFGRWYYHYETDNNNIAFQLKKLEEPHRLLHEAALAEESCEKNCESCTREECLKNALKRIEGEYMPKILQLIDDAKELFLEESRSMVIVVDNGAETFALAVDEVLSVEDLVKVAGDEHVEKLQGSKYISEVRKSPKISRMILFLNDTKLQEITKEFRLNEI